MRRASLFATTIALIGLAVPGISPGEDARSAAKKVDQLLRKELLNESRAVGSRTDDETFLRRVFLDLIGEPPTPDDVIAFALDQRPDKRSKIVDRLLKDEAYARNWGRYWRDVIMYRRTEQRAGLAVQPLENYLTEQLQQNTAWDQIVTSLITASGDVRENGATGLIMAQGGRPEETVAEVSRIFMGIQIQCAQCHDHPTDSWKREQFHQLAAFFPRVAVRPNRNGTDRTFLVVANDSPFRFRRRANNNNRVRGTPEHRMPNLKDPSQQGQLMQPVLFSTGQKLEAGALDKDRRGTLAKWMTAPQNTWFARALVNRLWSELVGEGFYEPVDDMGPERECSAPETLNHLAKGFVDQKFDVQWLLKTIVATDAYQRKSQPRRNLDQVPFATNCPQRLRADQLFDSLKAVLDFSEPTARAGGAYGVRFGPRQQFNTVFGYDPSEPRAEVSGSVAQALLFMNSPLINQSINARRNASLGKILREHADDTRAVTELYLKTLARQPSKSELKTCLAHVKEVGERSEAFEDILWAMINSTEFLYRR